MSKPFLTILRARPALAHFGRCWRAIRRTSSRRTTEAALAAILFAFALRLAQAVHWFPAWPPGHSEVHYTTLSVAANAFIEQMWPSPYFWLTALVTATLLTVIGMQQTVAAFNVARTCSAASLTDTGEDDAAYLTSVDPEWLLWDVILRRAGMAIGMAFFAQYAWGLAVKTGLASIPFVVLAVLCSWVDNRLWDTTKDLRKLIDRRRRAEREVVSVVRERGYLPP